MEDGIHTLKRHISKAPLIVNNKPFLTVLIVDALSNFATTYRLYKIVLRYVRPVIEYFGSGLIENNIADAGCKFNIQ